MIVFDSKECTDSEATYTHIQKVVSSVPLSKVITDLSTKFYKSNEVIEFLYSVLTSRGNGILHGPGGFGKSHITKEFLKYYNIDSVVKVGNSSTDVESLLGIPNIEKLTKDSEYNVAFNKSVFSIPGVLILEEFLDVKPTVAAALKDILSEGGYRQGNEFTKSLIGPIIICSNKTPEEVSVDLSTAAFYKERFPYSSYVCWEDFSYTAFFEFFKLLYGDEVDTMDQYQLLADICSTSCTNDNIISPRLAIKARDLFISSGNIKSLKYISSIDYSKIETVEYNLKERRFFESLDAKVTSFKKIISNLEIDSPETYQAFIHITEEIKTTFQGSSIVGDALIKNVSELMTLIDIKKSEFDIQLRSMGKSLESKLPEIKQLKNDICTYLNQ